MGKKPFWSKAGEPATFPNPMEGEYSTGDSATGRGAPLSPNNAAFVGPASDTASRKTAFHRAAMGQTEAIGARLSISPSDKIPQNDPASGMTQSNTRIVKSKVGRSTATFRQGMG